MPTFNNKETKKKGIWKDKVYTKQIMEYTNQSLRPDEKGVYDVIFNSLVERFDLKEVNELMLLDLAVNDFIRVKRLHLILKDGTDMVQIKTRGGQMVSKANEAGYLINAVETQFRQSMKELLLTPKSRITKTIGQAPKDFTEALGTVIHGEFTEDDKDGKDDESGVEEVEKRKVLHRDKVREDKQEDRGDGKTSKDTIKNGTTGKVTA